MKLKDIVGAFISGIEISIKRLLTYRRAIKAIDREAYDKCILYEREDGGTLRYKNKEELIYQNRHELHFRAVVSPTTIIDFTLKDLVDIDRFSIREILIPWLRKGGHPILIGEWGK
jgi:hypothetical protein